MLIDYSGSWLLKKEGQYIRRDLPLAYWEGLVVF